MALSAKKFIFISLRNKLMLERAVGQELDNAFHTLNAIPSSTISANKLSQQKTISLVERPDF
ncbi:MAG: hypothetical protein IPP43_03470 [Chitinophagaceae bacterium]|nr:hypothetical protein [Chitinophagaceae bacterium]